MTRIRDVVWADETIADWAKTRWENRPGWKTIILSLFVTILAPILIGPEIRPYLIAFLEGITNIVLVFLDSSITTKVLIIDSGLFIVVLYIAGKLSYIQGHLRKISESTQRRGKEE